MAVPFPVTSLPSHSASRAPGRKRDRLPSLYIYVDQAAARAAIAEITATD
jgi:hypothetical protein